MENLTEYHDNKNKIAELERELDRVKSESEEINNLKAQLLESKQQSKKLDTELKNIKANRERETKKAVDECRNKWKLKLKKSAETSRKYKSRLESAIISRNKLKEQLNTNDCYMTL
tara:strand:- start:1958 stop:2305 length:348 start_codon:yes stop_codon:yes gene_type:complete